MPPSLDDTITEDRREQALDALVALGRDTEPSFHPQGEGRYRMLIPSPGVVLELDYLRRERGHLHGELLVRADLAAARTVEGVLSVSDLNLSSSISRKKHGEYLAERAPGAGVDWVGLLEDFAQRVLTAERAGSPGVWLNELPRPAKLPEFAFRGLRLLRSHPTCIFGKGSAGKSLLSAAILGDLVRQGVPVGYFDWELDEEEQRRRWGDLFGEDLMPRVRYLRCHRALIHEADGLRKLVAQYGLRYVLFDSVGYACDGPAESHEVAMRYVQALRSLGSIGSLHLAHSNRAEDGKGKMPFGSVFWFNSMRSIWFVEGKQMQDRSHVVTLRHRKANLGPLLPDVGFRFTFGGDRVGVQREDPLPDGEEDSL